jgi:hypothetical protein
MRLQVGDVKLFFDVEGAKAAPSGREHAGNPDSAAARSPRIRSFRIQGRLFAVG